MKKKEIKHRESIVEEIINDELITEKIEIQLYSTDFQDYSQLTWKALKIIHKENIPSKEECFN